MDPRNAMVELLDWRIWKQLESGRALFSTSGSPASHGLSRSYQGLLDPYHHAATRNPCSASDVSMKPRFCHLYPHLCPPQAPLLFGGGFKARSAFFPCPITKTHKAHRASSFLSCEPFPQLYPTESVTLANFGYPSRTKCHHDRTLICCSTQ